MPVDSGSQWEHCPGAEVGVLSGTAEGEPAGQQVCTGTGDGMLRQVSVLPGTRMEQGCGVLLACTNEGSWEAGSGIGLGSAAWHVPMQTSESLQ